MTINVKVKKRRYDSYYCSAFIIVVIQNGMDLTGVESYIRKVLLDVGILGTVLLDMLKKRDVGMAGIMKFLAGPKTKRGNDR